MTRYLCAECGAEAVTVSPDRNTVPEGAEIIVPDVTHCSDPACAKSDPHGTVPGDFVRVDAPTGQD